MKKITFPMLAVVLLTSVWSIRADTQTEIKQAIKKLEGRPNYSWIATPKSDEGTTPAQRQGPIEGKTERKGFTYFRFVLGEDTVEAAFKGAKSAIRSEGVWESESEMIGQRAWIARRLKAFKPLADEAEELLEKTRALKKEGANLYSGDLDPEAVKEMLLLRSREGGQNRETAGAKGSVRFWIQNGVLAKYEFNLRGRLVSPTQQTFDINRTTTVEIKDVGSTRVEIPDQAKKKLR